MQAERFRSLPKVDRVLGESALAAPLSELPRDIVVRLVQEEVEALRETLMRGADGPATQEEAQARVAARVRSRLDCLRQPTLRRVINATGVVLHTNIGRAPLGDGAIAALVDAARGYINLEYDLESGARTSRRTSPGR